MNPSLLFEVGVSLALQIALLIGFALLLDHICDSARRSGPIWTATFVATLGLAFAAFVLPHARWLRLPAFEESSTPGTVLRWQILAVKVAVGIWLAGLVVSLLRRLHRFLTLQHFLRVRCRSLTPQELECLPKRVVARAPAATRWLLSDQTHGPFCWQMHRPTIVLPQSIFDLDAETQTHILRHEYEHLRTGHPVQHFLQGLCGTLLWFHPAVRWAARRAELTREFWCDEVAANSREGVAGYLRSLATISEQNSEAPPCTHAIGRRGNAIVRRTRRLVELTKRRDWPSEDINLARRNRFAMAAVILAAALVSQLWLPVNLLASDRQRLSPWPSWTARVLHDFGVSVRDFEAFDHRREAHELLYPDD